MHPPRGLSRDCLPRRGRSRGGLAGAAGGPDRTGDEAGGRGPDAVGEERRVVRQDLARRRAVRRGTGRRSAGGPGRRGGPEGKGERRAQTGGRHRRALEGVHVLERRVRRRRGPGPDRAGFGDSVRLRAGEAHGVWPGAPLSRERRRRARVGQRQAGARAPRGPSPRVRRGPGAGRARGRRERGARQDRAAARVVGLRSACPRARHGRRAGPGDRAGPARRGVEPRRRSSSARTSPRPLPAARR